MQTNGENILMTHKFELASVLEFLSAEAAGGGDGADCEGGAFSTFDCSISSRWFFRVHESNSEVLCLNLKSLHEVGSRF